MALDTTQEGKPYLSAVWVWDETAGAYTNNTNAARRAGSTDFAVLDASADYLYLGSESKFDLLGIILGTVGSIGALTYEYVTASGDPNTWTEFVPETPFYAEEESFNFTENGALTVGKLTGWASDALSATNPHSATPPDLLERYWIRISVASSATAPQISRIFVRPRASYCTPTDVAKMLQVADFSASTTPTRSTVEDAIFAAEGYIDYYTQKSWRVNYVQEDHEEFNLSGTRLKRRDAFKISKAEVWTGSNWQAKSEGRDADYFLLPDRNMLFWSRFFLLPARFAASRSGMARWGFGEFLKPLRVSYFYGKNKDMDEREFPVVFDIARKLAAIDVWASHDYSILAVSGSDKISLDQKVSMWKEDTENKIESLKSWNFT